jgi:hypothetical protein
MSDLSIRKAATAPGQPSFSCSSRFAAVEILSTSPTLDANTKRSLTVYLVSGIIAAEARRIGWWEWAGEQILPISIDPSIPLLGRLDPAVRDLHSRTGGQGPGQLYPKAYMDVMQNLKPELDKFFTHMGVCVGLHRGCGAVPLTLLGYPRDVIDPIRSDFFIAAYLALRLKQAAKPGRLELDQLQFGIGLYAGAWKTLVRAQTAICPQSPESVVQYAPVRDWLLRSSDPKDNDVAAYIQEVYLRR